MPACLAAMERDNTHARQAGRGTRRCPPVWQNGTRQHTCQTGGPRNQKMPACLAEWNTTTHMPDRRAEEPEDARLSGRMEHDNTHARQAGRGTRRCPPVWQDGARQHTCQTGGPRNQKMPACLAGWSTTTHMPDRRAEEPEDARLSGSMEHDNTHARQAGRGTRRCPPVWQPWNATTHMPDRRAEEPEDARLSGRMEHDNTHARQAGRGTRRCPPVWQDGARQHTCQTGGPRNQKMPACLAAMERDNTHARQAGRGTRRCPPVWQNGTRQHTCQTGGPRNQKMPACLAEWSTTTHMPDRRAEELEDARLSGRMEHDNTHARQAGRGTRRCPPVWQDGARQHTCQTGGPRNQKMPACLAAWSTTTHMPDRRAEEPEDARLSGSMEHDNTHARQAGRGTRRCPPVWQHGARQHTCQAGGPRNQKMPACLAAWSTTHMPDRRAEEPEDARLSGSQSSRFVMLCIECLI